MKTTSLGLPHADLNLVITSYLGAMGKIYFDPVMQDPLKAWAGYAAECRFLKAKMADQLINQIGSGKRFDRIKANRPALFLEHLRKVWIVEGWVSFHRIEDEITEDHWNEIGLAYFTDETASAIIAYAFPELGDFTKKQFEDFRKNHGLEQVPLAHRRSGIVVKGRLKIDRIGRKRV